MKFKNKIKQNNKRKWHEWFAWYPVKTEDGKMTIFWEYVLRKEYFRNDWGWLYSYKKR